MAAASPPDPEQANIATTSNGVKVSGGANSEDWTVEDLTSEVEERLKFEAGGGDEVDCLCEAVGGDEDSLHFECKYQVKQQQLPPPEDSGEKSDEMKEMSKTKKLQQGVVAVKVP